MLIVDHKQKDIPANSFSYTYIDKSLRHSALEDSEDHRAGPAQLPPRPVGSSVATAKGTRTPFSAEDDQILLAWVGENAVAGRDAGNKIFQELGAKVHFAILVEQACFNIAARIPVTHGSLGGIAT